MVLEEFLKEVVAIYHKYLPHSECLAKFDTRLYRSISIECFLAGNKTEFPQGCRINDMLKVLLYVQTDGNMQFPKNTDLNTEMPINLQFESSNTFYLTIPDVPYSVYGNRKIPFRKTHGTPEKLLSAFDSFCNKLSASIVDDYLDGAIHDNYRALVKQKIADLI